MRTYQKIKRLPPLLAILTLCFSCQPETNEQPYLMGLGYGIYGTTLMVDDLEKATSFYMDTLGFDIDDEISEGDLTGSIVTTASFPDLAELELMALNDSVENRIIPSFFKNFLASNQGVRLFSLSSSSADSTSEWLNSKGFQMDVVQPYRSSEEPDGWSWDDGGPELKSLDFDVINPPAHLPRFIEETDMNYVQSMKQWRTYYGYGRRYDSHPNGVVGMAAIRIAVDDLKASTKEFKKMGFEALETNDSTTHFKLIRNQELHLLAAKTEQIKTFLTQRGEGVFALRFDVSNLDSTYQFLNKRLAKEVLIKRDELLVIPPQYAFGVQLEF